MKKPLYYLDQYEKQRILEMHKKATNQLYLKESFLNKNSEDIIITDWLSPDERYVIFLDELYDLKNKKNLGDIWENSSNLVTFLEHSFRVSSLSKTLKEETSKIINNILLTENVIDLSLHKKEIKEYFLKEDILDKVWGGAKKWAKGAWQNTKKGVSDFASDVVSGSKEFGKAVVSGDWDEIVRLAKKGTLYLARKIRQAVYSEAGLIIDTILIVSGVGKVAQFVVWAIVVGLDIYEFTTKDYEHKDDPNWLRIIFFVIDVIGLVSAGSAALAARNVAKATLVGARTTEEAAMLIGKSPAMKNVLETGVKGLNGASGKMIEAGGKLGVGKLGSWFKSVLSGMGKFFKYLGETLTKLLSWKTIKAGAKTTAVVGGIGTGIELYKDYKKSENKLTKKQEDNLIKSMQTQDADFSEYI